MDDDEKSRSAIGCIDLGSMDIAAPALSAATKGEEINRGAGMGVLVPAGRIGTGKLIVGNPFSANAGKWAGRHLDRRVKGAVRP